MAPLGGGIIVDQLGRSWLFIITTVLTSMVIYFYSVMDNLPRLDFVEVKT
jgi:hypothetical protein